MGDFEKPFIIPIFIPHAGCPHQCAFCNQRTITRTLPSVPSSEQLCIRINEFLQYKGKHRKTVQIAFYGGNFLGLKHSETDALLHEAHKFVLSGKADSIRFSTRPDTITADRLDRIRQFPVSTIELGVQSMDDTVLAASKRGHTALDTENAVRLLKKRNYTIGMQMMVGLPGDDETKSLETGRKIASLLPDFVRIYPTVVLENSLLARWYRNGQYIPMLLDQCVTLVKHLYHIFREKHISVIRMGLQAEEDFEKESVILAGPYHPAFGHMVYSEIFLDMVMAELYSGHRSQVVGRRSHFSALSTQHSALSTQHSVQIKVHPRSISKMRGLKNKNIEILKSKFHLKEVRIIADNSLSEETVSVMMNDKW